MSNSVKLPDKSYKVTANEKEIFDLWQEERLYDFDPDNLDPAQEIFTIDTPPPYTNSQWHLGNTIHYLMIDMIARIQRMKGYKVHFPMGLDRNGLPIEISAEKKFKVSMHKMPRQEFLDLCQEILDEMGAQVLDLCYRIGMSCNSFEWDKVYKTDYPKYRALTQATFIEMWNKGLVYEDDRPNNWDYKLQTTLADAEIEYLEGSHEIHDIVFKIVETDEEFIFATTRPELIPAIRVIVYHPKDKRYHKLEGKTAKVPLWEIEVPIIAHASADPEFGSGLMQVCSYGDVTDVRTLR
ncbi:MAG: class I tRNA ligase family protein, partial [Candidatus Heimdallarchaeota archaeon]|nr:class I tRNA ligase family protein [Candidatus Heimdallarchaeota archaeon]